MSRLDKLVGKTKDLLRENKGNAYLNVAVFIVVIMMLFVVFMVYITTLSTLNNLNAVSEQTLSKTTTLTSIDIMDSVKNGNDYTSLINDYSFIDSITYELGLNSNNEYLDENGAVAYSVSDFDFSFVVDEKLNTKVKFTVSIPMNFMGVTITYINVPMTIVSRYTLKV